MKLFFDNCLDELKENEGRNNEREAIALIISTITDQRVFSAEEVQRNLLNYMLRDEIIKKLSNSIPMTQRIARNQFKNQLKKWLTSTNEERVY